MLLLLSLAVVIKGWTVANHNTITYAVPSTAPINPYGPGGNPFPVVATEFNDIQTIGCESNAMVVGIVGIAAADGVDIMALSSC
jgi:hypothetical protein